MPDDLQNNPFEQDSEELRECLRYAAQFMKPSTDGELEGSDGVGAKLIVQKSEDGFTEIEPTENLLGDKILGKGEYVAGIRFKTAPPVGTPPPYNAIPADVEEELYFKLLSDSPTNSVVEGLLSHVAADERVVQVRARNKPRVEYIIDV